MDGNAWDLARSTKRAQKTHRLEREGLGTQDGSVRDFAHGSQGAQTRRNMGSSLSKKALRRKSARNSRIRRGTEEGCKGDRNMDTEGGHTRRQAQYVIRQLSALHQLQPTQLHGNQPTLRHAYCSMTCNIPETLIEKNILQITGPCNILLQLDPHTCTTQLDDEVIRLKQAMPIRIPKQITHFSPTAVGGQLGITTRPNTCFCIRFNSYAINKYRLKLL